MARPSSARSAQIVCFSHATALEILLAMPSTQRQHPVRSRSYPAQAPSLSEVCQARDRVLECIPGLSLSTPLHVTSASTSHNHRTDAAAFHRSEGSFVGTGLLSVGEGVRTTTAATLFGGAKWRFWCNGFWFGRARGRNLVRKFDSGANSAGEEALECSPDGAYAPETQ